MPRIGLLSDSHGRAQRTHAAVQILRAAGVDMLIHLGDVGTIEVIDALATTCPRTGKQIQARLVFGNTDWDTAPLARYAADLDVYVDDPVGRLTLGSEEAQLVFCHGHQHQVMEQALREPVRYLCHGHTHQQADMRHGQTRVINPGALHRAREYSVAILDTDRDEVVFYPVPDRC